jgi:hypothetical protein
MASRIEDYFGRNATSVAVLAAICLLGLVLRVNALLGERAFWMDELNLLASFLTRDYRQLLDPLNEGQMAPYGFLLVVKWVGETFGFTETIARLPTFFAGLVTFGLFVLLARRFGRPSVALLAAFLFAASDWHIYYGAEMKQYAMDPFVAVLVYLFAIALLKEWTPSRLAGLAIVGLVGVWISHPSAFVLAAVGISLFARELSRGNKRNAVWLTVVGLLWMTSFAIHLLVTSSLSSQNAEEMQELHYFDFFMPFPPTSFADLQWYSRSIIAMFSSPLSFRFEGVAAILALVGCVSVYARDKFVLAILVLPPFFALVASAAELYPFMGRLLLFAVPGMLLLIAEGLVVAIKSVWPRAKIVAIALAGLALFHPLLDTMRQAFAATPYATEELPDVLERVAENYREGDRIYLYYAARLGFEFYAPQYGLDDAPSILGKSPRADWTPYLDDIAQIRCHRRVWIIFSHIRRSPNDEEQLLTYFLDRAGRRLEYFRAADESPLFLGHTGASAYLYEFAPASGTPEELCAGVQ